jgi:hypothetical protein
MCDTRQHDGSIEGEQCDASTLVPFQESTDKQTECGEESWRAIAKLAETETDPGKLMDLAQQFMDEMDREASMKPLQTWKSSTDVGKIPEEGQ